MDAAVPPLPPTGRPVRKRGRAVPILAVATAVLTIGAFVLLMTARSVAADIDWSCWGVECRSGDPRAMLLVIGIGLAVVAALVATVLLGLAGTRRPWLLGGSAQLLLAGAAIVAGAFTPTGGEAGVGWTIAATVLATLGLVGLIGWLVSRIRGGRRAGD